MDPTNPNVLYTGGTNTSGFFNIGKTTDGGAGWSFTDIGTTYGKMFGMAIDPVNTGTIYAAGYDNGAQAALYKTTDGGLSWNRLSSAGISGYYYTLAVDPLNTNIVYAGTYISLYKSTNGGVNWSTTGFTGGSTRALLAVDDPLAEVTKVYAGTEGNGVYVSDNGGATWTQMNAGLTDPYIRHLSFNNVDRYLFAGTACASIFRNQIPPVKVEESARNEQPTRIILMPNPCSEKVIFCFSTRSAAECGIFIYDRQGRAVEKIELGRRTSGTHRISWDGRDKDDLPLPAGVYFIDIRIGDRHQLGELIVAR